MQRLEDRFRTRIGREHQLDVDTPILASTKGTQYIDGGYIAR